MNKIIVLAAFILAHEWYPQACCSDIDCRPIPCGRLHPEKDGWHYQPNGFNYDLVFQTASPSPDEQCHGCWAAASMGIGRCLFIPMHST
jgi:hypothetical protein